MRIQYVIESHSSVVGGSLQVGLVESNSGSAPVLRKGTLAQTHTVKGSMVRAVIHARVPTRDQAADRHRLISHLDKCRKIALKGGFEVEGEFEGTDSGATLNRPQLEAIRQLLAGGQIDAAIVQDTARLSRNMADLKQLQEEISRYGTELRCVRD